MCLSSFKCKSLFAPCLIAAGNKKNCASMQTLWPLASTTSTTCLFLVLNVLSFSLCVSSFHQHKGNPYSATLKTSLFPLGSPPHSHPARYLCIAASHLSPQRGWKNPSPHLLTLLPSAAQKDSSLHACSLELQLNCKCKNNDGSN